MEGGFSGRGFDTEHVTPFLRKNDFPFMASGSGWLTRSLEQPAPFNEDYPGQISPLAVKNAFLKLIQRAQTSDETDTVLNILKEIFRQLVQLR